MENEVLELDPTFAEVQARQTLTQNPLVPTENIGAAPITSISSGSSGIGASVVGGVATLVSPLTTKGDLFTRSASAGTRLPVGADGDLVSADSGEATGLKWVTPIKNNIIGAAPTVDDDDTRGYSIFSLWCDTSGPNVYICQDATTGAANWAMFT